MSIHVTMKVIQIIKKQQKIVRSTRWSSGKYEKPNVKQSHNRGNSWVGRTKLQNKGNNWKKSGNNWYKEKQEK